MILEAIPTSRRGPRRAIPMRAEHTYGKGSRDIRRAVRRLSESDRPGRVSRDEKEVIRVLEWCDGAQIVALPGNASGSSRPRYPSGTVVWKRLERLLNCACRGAWSLLLDLQSVHERQAGVVTFSRPGGLYS
jgi:hypothetical protein